jgi:hypothetical protein
MERKQGSGLQQVSAHDSVTFTALIANLDSAVSVSFTQLFILLHSRSARIVLLTAGMLPFNEALSSALIFEYKLEIQ